MAVIEQPTDPTSELFVRLKEVEREILTESSITKVDISNDWPYEQSTFPYVTNRLLSPLEEQKSEDVGWEFQQVGIRVVGSHFTETNVSGRALSTYRVLNALRRGLRRHPWNRLRVKAVANEDNDWLLTEPTWLAPRYVVVNPHTGLGVFAAGGVGNSQVGVELTISIDVFWKVF